LSLGSGCFGLAVIGDVSFCCFASVVVCELCMAVREMSVMSSRFRISGLVVLSRLSVMFRCVLMVFCCFRMVLGYLLCHSSSPYLGKELRPWSEMLTWLHLGYAVEWTIKP
jgi:hypothetical protein